MIDFLNKYTDFISSKSNYFYEMFGDIWWYSLLYEKNTTKSRALHNIIKNLPPEKYNIFISILNGGKKFLTYFFRYLFFGTDFDEVKYKKIAVEYFDHLSIKQKILIPQKSNYKRVFNKIINCGEVFAIDQFISFSDFFIIGLIYLKTLYKYWTNRKDIERNINEVKLYRYLKKEILRSFTGDILVEGLFFERLFKRAFGKYIDVEEIQYVYEGQAWERALCIAVDKVNRGRLNKIRLKGVLCSTPSISIRNYFYTPTGCIRRPKQAYLEVFGDTTRQLFSNGYFDHIEIVKTSRFEYLKEIINGPKTKGIKDYVLVILPYNTDEAIEVFKFVKKANLNNRVLYRIHPNSDIKKIKKILGLNNWELADGRLNKYLKLAEYVICTDSSVAFEALAYNRKIIIPELKSFIINTPLYKVADQFYTLIKTSEELKERLEEDSIIDNDYGEIRQFLNNYFNFEEKI